MGNEQAISYNLEKFIEEVEGQILQNCNPNILEIKDSLEKLRYIFNKDHSLYLNYKLIEKEMIKLKESNLSSGIENGGNIDRKTIKFCRLFSRIPLIIQHDKSSIVFDQAINIYLDIYEYLSNQRTFLEFFNMTTVDFLIELIISKVINNISSIEFSTIFRLLKLFQNLLLLMKNKTKYFNSNTIQN